MIFEFPFLKDMDNHKKVISIVGAGGKSSLLHLLAEIYSDKGFRVLVSTTTHIFKPRDHYASSRKELEAFWKNGTYGVVGEFHSENGMESFPCFLWKSYRSI